MNARTALVVGTAIVFFTASPAARFGPRPAHAAQSCGWTIVSTPSPAGSDAELEGVSELTAANVWAVANTRTGNLVEHWNGKAWKIIPGPAIGAHLDAIAAVSAKDVWFAGQRNNPPVTEHWNGSAISVVPNAAHSGNIEGMWAGSSTDVWASGFVDETKPAIVERWNGTSWAMLSSRPDFDARAISGASPSDIWVAGNGVGGSEVPESEIAHWNGTSWSGGAHGPFGDAGSELWAVLEISKTNVWTTESGGNPDPFMANFNGTKWKSYGAKPTSASFVALADSGANRVLAAGGSQSQHAVIDRWNGTAWRPLTLPKAPGTNSFLGGVTTGPRGDAWAVGAYGTNGTLTHTLAMHDIVCR